MSRACRSEMPSAPAAGGGEDDDLVQTLSVRAAHKGRALSAKPKNARPGDVVVGLTAQHDRNGSLPCEIWTADGKGGGAWHQGSWCVILEYASLRVTSDYPVLAKLTAHGVEVFDASECARGRARVSTSRGWAASSDAWNVTPLSPRARARAQTRSRRCAAWR